MLLISSNKKYNIEITWYDYQIDQLDWWGANGQKHSSPINNQRVFEDMKLQELVKHINKPVSLTSEAAVTAYAMDLIPILIECSYLEDDWIPFLACHYSHGVWVVCYTHKDSDYKGFALRDGTVDVYFSDADGHIIFINYPGIYMY